MYGYLHQIELQLAASSILVDFSNHCIRHMCCLMEQERELMYPCLEMNQRFYLLFELAVDYRQTMNKLKHFLLNWNLQLELDFLGTITHLNTIESDERPLTILLLPAQE